MKEMIKYGLILGVICFLAGGLLSAVNAVTESKIQLQKEKEEKAALSEVLPEAVKFRPKLQQDKINYYIAYDRADNIKGFALKSKSRGYASDIEALTGLNLNLEITNIKILSQNETPGLGNRILEPNFSEQFKGKNLESFNQVQAITGATISSQVVINSVKTKISELKEELLQDIKDAR